MTEPTTLGWLLTELKSFVAGAVPVFIGAALAFYWNYWLQRRVDRRREAAELKQQLYEFLELVTDFWTSGPRDDTASLALHEKIKVRLYVVMMECRLMKRHSKKLRAWYESKEVEYARINLIDAATDFRETWGPDWQRVARSRIEITYIINTLYEAC